MMKGNEIKQIHNNELQALNVTNSIRGSIKNFQPDNPNITFQTLYTQSLIITASNPSSARSATIILSA